MNPETFEQLMQLRLGRDFRLRWIPQTETWNIEQKVGRGTVEVPLSYSDPAYERVRDGYALVMEISPSPHMRCDTCRAHIDVPVGKFAETRCSFCYSMGEKSMWFIGYFPLSDMLLTHLDRLKPERVSDAIRERIKKNYEVERTRTRDYENRRDAHLRDYHSHIVGIPQFGYTGRGR